MTKTKNSIQYKSVVHRGEMRIAIEFAYNADWIARVRKLADARWSKTLKAWHIPDTLENRKMLGLAINEAEEKKDSNNTSSYFGENGKASKTIVDHFKEVAPVNQPILPLTKQALVLKGYSANTQKTYLNEIACYLKKIGQRNANEITTEQLKKYLQYCFEVQKLSENTMHSRLNALKFYYEQVLKREKLFWDVPRPKKPIQLPKVLNEKELKRLFDAATNLKHKALLFVAYSAGLRVSEVINLRLQDIDRERMQLFIRCSKGKKDRYVMLSPIVLDILEQYYKKSVVKPVNYVFESNKPGEPYTIRSAQQIFSNCKSNAGIMKSLSFHSLRHSFATHVLEKGIDVIFIKEILGHFDLKTTQRYLHVRKNYLVNIESPIDGMYRKA